jgi:Uma2 family endonuclease
MSGISSIEKCRKVDMIAQRESQRMTVDEWRTLERQSHDIKHEYIDGWVYAMSGGSLTHARIGFNACAALENALLRAGKGCYVYNSDAATHLSSRRYTYPDASVSCDERDHPTPDKTEVLFPCGIIEVLSDSTEGYDRGEKFGYYQACPTVQEYVMISTRYQRVEVYHRIAHMWTYQVYESGNTIELKSMGIHLSVAELYRNSGVPEATNDPEGEV